MLVSGRLDQRSFEGKDGVKRSRVEIVVEDFNFTGAARTDGGSNSPSAPEVEAPVPDEIPEGDIDLSEVPF